MQNQNEECSAILQKIYVICCSAVRQKIIDNSNFAKSQVTRGEFCGIGPTTLNHICFFLEIAPRSFKRRILPFSPVILDTGTGRSYGKITRLLIPWVLQRARTKCIV